MSTMTPSLPHGENRVRAGTTTATSYCGSRPTRSSSNTAVLPLVTPSGNQLQHSIDKRLRVLMMEVVVSGSTMSMVALRSSPCQEHRCTTPILVVPTSLGVPHSTNTINHCKEEVVTADLCPSLLSHLINERGSVAPMPQTRHSKATRLGRLPHFDLTRQCMQKLTS